MSIGARLRDIRLDVGDDQKTMSRRFGLGDTTWQRLELEDRVPKGEVLAQLIAMGFSVDWLVTGMGQMRQGETSRQLITDHRLIGRLTEKILQVYKEMGFSIALHQAAERAAQEHDRIVATTADPDDRLIQIGVVMSALRQELNAKAADPATSKRQV